MKALGLVFGLLMLGDVALSKDRSLGGEAWFLGQDMKLSGVSSEYDNVSAGAGWSFYYLSHENSWLRIGGGAFGLNGDSRDTEVGMYGGGFIAEAIKPFGDFDASTSVQLGGAGVTVTHKEADTSSEAVDAGTFTQGGGWLVAPQVSIGYRIDPVRVYGFGRSTQFVVGSEDIRKFSNHNYGVGVASQL